VKKKTLFSLEETKERLEGSSLDLEQTNGKTYPKPRNILVPLQLPILLWAIRLHRRFSVMCVLQRCVGKWIALLTNIFDSRKPWKPEEVKVESRNIWAGEWISARYLKKQRASLPHVQWCRQENARRRNGKGIRCLDWLLNILAWEKPAEDCWKALKNKTRLYPLRGPKRRSRSCTRVGARPVPLTG